MYLENKKQKFKNGFLVGGILGSFLTYMVASKKTKQFRTELLKDFDAMYDLLRDKVAEANDLGRSAFEKLAEKVADEYTKNRDISQNFKETLMTELKAKWSEMQVFFLYSKIRSKLKRAGDVTREKFENVVEEIVGDFADENDLNMHELRKLNRKIKSKWNHLRSDLDLEDE